MGGQNRKNKAIYFPAIVDELGNILLFIYLEVKWLWRFVYLILMSSLVV